MKWAALREYYWSLLSWIVAKEKGLVLGVNIVAWGLRWGSRGSLMADTWPLAMDEVGVRDKKVHFAGSREYY